MVAKGFNDKLFTIFCSKYHFYCSIWNIIKQNPDNLDRHQSHIFIVYLHFPFCSVCLHAKQSVVKIWEAQFLWWKDKLKITTSILYTDSVVPCSSHLDNVYVQQSNLWKHFIWHRRYISIYFILPFKHVFGSNELNEFNFFCCNASYSLEPV